MGCGAQSKVAEDACFKTLDTGVLVESHMHHTENSHHSVGLGAAELYVDDNVLYVAGNKGLALFDIAAPAASERIGGVIDTGALSYHGGATTVKNGNILYLAGGNGLRVVDTSEPKKPALLGSVIDTGALANDAGVAGGIAVASTQPLTRCLYLAGGKGLAVLDLSDPKAPSKIGDVIDTGALSYNCGVAMVLLEAKNIMYLVGAHGLVVMDITVRTKPQVAGRIAETGAIRWGGGAAMKVKDNFLYVGGGKGLAVFDISEPKAPKKLNFQDTGCFPGDGAAEMLLEESTLICLGGRGMRFFSLEQGDKPVACGGVISTGVCSGDGGVGLIRAGNMLCVAGGKGLGLFKYDMLLKTCDKA
eukprot:TRINITY_DN14240_c0_g2_i1.p1 TRINITY_DN14240_c0_g2~~TRINITY_DN14240_c0_g2_i1.p1  ORF type:complete len:360 (-),score=62.93 TRINITY_DN14240_c0_g2_i1:269-1348(-)